MSAKHTTLEQLKMLAHRTKNITDTLGGRVDNLESAGGEPNVITGVKVNGTLLTLVNKIAEILIAEGTTNGTVSVNNVDVAVKGLAALAYKSEVAESDLATALKNAINAKASQSALDTLTGSGDGSISKMIDDAFDDFSTKVTNDGVVNSYKELIDYVAAHGSEATTMAGNISSNAAAITNLSNLIGALPEGATSTTVVGYIAEAIAALSIGDYAKTTEVTSAISTALAGYYTKTEIDAMRATDAEVQTMLTEVFGAASAGEGEGD